VRFWPRRRPPDAPPRWEDLLPLEALLRAQVDDVLAVEQRQLWGRSLAFGGRLRLPAGAALDVLRGRLEPQGYTPFLREEQGMTWLYTLPRAAVTRDSRPLVNLALFLGTIVTTLVAGAMFPIGTLGFSELLSSPGRVLEGLHFSLALLTILGIHELGHYTLGRWHGMPISLPYFIPVPPPFLVGTLGAFIRLRGPVRDRRALFDMAVAGPLAGLVLAVPIYAIGLGLSSVRPMAPATEGSAEVVLGFAVLPALLAQMVLGAVPPNHAIDLHPVAVAGWFGFFVTALNLIPAGQLDGGHLVYALFGRRHGLISKLAVGALMAIGLYFGSPTWLVWSALIVGLMGFQHGPPMDDITPLGPARRALGLATLALVVVLLPPVPIGVY
jgi:membrane-associated protease RseP (regulator of RpoE activity)